jgi:hypothetical protein
MANHFSHAGLPYPIRNARFTVQLGYLDATGTPTDPVTPDTEVSKDGGAFADCVEEVTTITGSNGVGYITLTGAEMDASMVALAGKVASGPKVSLIPDIRPRKLPFIFSGTLVSGSASGGTLATDVPNIAGVVAGCILLTTGGTGGGGTGGANNQARMITVSAANRVITVSPNFEVALDNTTTYQVLLTEFALWRYADVQTMLGDDATINRQSRGANSCTLGTVGSGSTTTSIVTSSLSPAAAVASQFIGRVVLFNSTTTTVNLRGQSTKITASTSGGVLTVDPLTTAPVSGDTFLIG